MASVKWLALMPFLGVLVGTPYFNRVEPLILGMPLILAWIVMWIVLSAIIMAIIYRLDPANREVQRSPYMSAALTIIAVTVWRCFSGVARSSR